MAAEALHHRPDGAGDPAGTGAAGAVAHGRRGYQGPAAGGSGQGAGPAPGTAESRGAPHWPRQGIVPPICRAPGDWHPASCARVHCSMAPHATASRCTSSATCTSFRTSSCSRPRRCTRAFYITWTTCAKSSAPLPGPERAARRKGQTKTLRCCPRRWASDSRLSTLTPSSRSPPSPTRLTRRPRRSSNSWC